MLKHLDLFSGIGGFALGFRWAGGFETVAFCEPNTFKRAVIAEYWPEVPCYDQVSNLRGLSLSDLERGWERPCQPATSPRLRPDWLVVENGFHRWRAWVPELRRRLWARGYASVPFRMRAAEVGAHHDRSRCFVIAHTNGLKLREFTRWWRGQGREMAQELAVSRDWAPGPVGTANGISRRMDRCHALGDAIVPQIAELIGRAILAVEIDQSV